MISLVGKSTSPDRSRILLISPPPVNTIDRRADLASRDPPLELDRDFEVTRSYAEAVRNVAREEGVAFVDAWTKIWKAAGEQEIGLKEFLKDGLHLNAAGYDVGYSTCRNQLTLLIKLSQIVYEELVRVIAMEYPDVHYDNIPFVFPW